jgi:hypothetical protein
MITWQHIYAFCIFIMLLIIVLGVGKLAWGWV